MIRVAFDVRDPIRSGIARVARSMARAFGESDPEGRYETCFCGPIDRLRELGASSWTPRSQLVSWNAGRFSLKAELEWRRVTAAVGACTWYFPHWDMPFFARPARSIVLVSDVIPIVVPGATTRSRRLLARRWIRRSGLRASRITVSTEFTKGELLDLWPDFADKVRVIPLGVEHTFFGEAAPLPKPLVELAERGPFMLSVGNRKVHKNLEMGPEVLARIPHLHWIVVGETFSGWQGVLAKASGLGVADRVHVLNQQPDSVIHSLYANSACLFFPSRNEGFGLPILEALAAGTNVVVGAAGASIEVLSGHGFVCGLDDADGFAAAVEKSLAARPSEAGRTYAQGFTWQRSATLLSRIIEELEPGDRTGRDLSRVA